MSDWGVETKAVSSGDDSKDLDTQMELDILEAIRHMTMQVVTML